MLIYVMMTIFFLLSHHIEKLYVMFKVKKHCSLMVKTASSINTFLPTAFILLRGLKMWQQCKA